MFRRVLLRVAVTTLLLILLVAWVYFRTRHQPPRQHAVDATTLVLAQSSDMESMEPDNLNSASSVNIANLLWGRLLNITPDGHIVPAMASSYTWNESGNEITFHLRNGLRCGDGSPLTAQDVVYTLNRAADHSNGFYGNLPAFVYSAIGFEKAWAKNDNEATVRVRAYSSQVPGMLSQAYILCRKDYEHLSPAVAASHAYATGPYRMVEWLRDDRIVLEKNPQYSLAKAPFSRIILRIIPEASTRVAELLAGNVDVISNVPPDQVAAVNASGVAHVQVVDGTRRIFVGFNLSPRFARTEGGAAIQNKAVRQALEYAIDVPTLCTQLLQHPCERMASPVQKDHTHVEAYAYDPDKSERLLDAAGYPKKADGIRFHLTLQGPRARYLEDVNVAQAVAQYLGDVGVATNVEAMDFNSVFAPRARQHEVGELFLSGNGGALWSPLFDLSLFPTKLANTNTGEWYSKSWHDDLHALDGVRDPTQEGKIVDHMQEVFRDEAPWIFLYFQPDFYAYGPRVSFQARRDELVDVMAIQPKH